MSLFPAQTQSFTLYGSGATVLDTTLVLSSFNDINGNPVAMSSLGSIGFGTIEPNSGPQEDSITFTGITNNANGTVTLTGVQSVGFLYPFATSTGLAKSHAGSTTFIISNTSYFYYTAFGILQNNDAISGFWTAPDPITNQGVATKHYVDTLVNGGTVSIDQVIVTGTAGENLTKGQPVYLKNDGKWYKASTISSVTCLNVELGICQTTATANTATTVLTEGTDKTQSGLSIGATYYIQDSAGTIGTAPGTNKVDIGVAITSTNLDFQPFFSTAVNQANAGSLVPVLPTGSGLEWYTNTPPTSYYIQDGSAVSRVTDAPLFNVLCPANTVTITIASPAVISATAHGYVAGDIVVFTTTGSLPTGINAGTSYFVISAGLTANAFEISATLGGSAVNTSGSQSGTQTVRSFNWGVGDGATTFNLPDKRGFIGYGRKSSDVNFDNLNVPTTYVGEKNHTLTIAELASHTHPITIGSSAFNGPTFRGAGDTITTGNSGSTGGDTGHNNLPPYKVVNWIIKR